MAIDLSSASDASLVSQLLDRDEASLQELYRRHGGIVYGVAMRTLGDAGRAEEIHQDVFLRLWNKPERFDSTRGELRSFLLREAHSRSIDRLRSERARSNREDRHDREAVRNGEDIEREVWQLIRSERVREAVGQLQPTEREAIMLAYFGGYTYREVATMLGEAEGTIKGRIRLGLKKLADRLEAVGLGVTE